MKKPMNPQQVLAAWLETQIGFSTFVRPRGFETGSSGTSPWADTRRRAATLVESFPTYDAARPHLVAYCQAMAKPSSVAEVFLQGLTAHLQDYPFYASSGQDDSEERKPVVYLTCEEAADALGVKPQTIRNMVCKGVFRHTVSFRRQLSIWADEVYAYKENRGK